MLDAQSGKPLEGVNIVLLDHELGTITDKLGLFSIINVEPGQYSVQASMIGYAIIRMTHVDVIMNQTTVIKLFLKQKSIQLDEVLVEAKKLLVIHDVSSSRMDYSNKDITVLPVATISEAIGLQAGVQGLSIRGGGRNQTALIMNGFLLNDERSNNPYASLSLNSIKEIQVQTGGFNAEYGNIRSGIINIITDDGSYNKISGAITIRNSPPAQKHFGESVYSASSYFLRPFLDDDVCWVGTTNGNWDSNTIRQYPSFEGWNSISEMTFADDDPSNDVTPQSLQQIFKWQHRRNGIITKPDYTVDFTVGGPVPALYERLGKLRFHFSYYSRQNVFIFPLSRDSYYDEITNLKLTSTLSNSIKLTLMGLHGKIQSTSPYNWKTTPTGYVLESSFSVADLVNSSSGDAILFMPGFFSPTDIYRSMFGMKLNHMMNPGLFYDFTLQYFQNEYNTFQIEQRDTSKIYEVFPGYFADEAPYGYWGYSVTGNNGMIMGGWMNLGRDKSVNSTAILKFDLTNQINMRNQLKTGLQLIFNTYNVKSFTENPSMNTWNRSLEYKVSPMRAGLYLQDKLEYEGFIANMGLRLDYLDANTVHYVLDDFDEFYEQGSGHAIESGAPTEETKSVLKLSPRLGISHPITETSKLYFNYGHFQSEPSSSYRFRLQRESNGLVTNMGNPNMVFEQTIAYELGYSQSWMDYLFNLAAYYKDVTNEPNWVYYANMGRSVSYYKAMNNEYEDIRGFEITISKKTGKWFTGFINYTYMVRSYGHFGLTKYFQDPQEQQEYLQLNPYQERPQPLPYWRGNIQLITPQNFGPMVFGIFRPIGGWKLNILGTYNTGSFATYNPNSTPGIVDNIQWKDRYNIDFRLNKSIIMKSLNAGIFIDVNNVLNTKFLSYAGFSDYYDYLDYIESLNFPWEEGVEHGNDRVGEYRDWDVKYDPLEHNLDNEPDIAARNADRKRTKSYIDMPNIKAFTFLNPIKITFGFTIHF
ncbi:MAG TPA: TonB-dependent receptor [Candidatus Marinimicrobia bacterium]|nr:TonB-dependent receptor [Candidatus Neomarinimicrobiota bacterium]MDP7566249.1 TonB-dependent receptor [Candidatus Neomarinimicrobiota bacterium]HJL75462.1 TonB-dependent receptor [Candidatus Neomarinimicrobiota bacterium]HJM70121.1 TonB-dependent receptor [Candidatus Neomarinimicrobiota bacterium]